MKGTKLQNKPQKGAEEFIKIDRETYTHPPLFTHHRLFHAAGAFKPHFVRYIDENIDLVTKGFMKKAAIFETDEFKSWREHKTICPNATMICKSIHKNPNKLNIPKNMTYENMAAYIREQEDATEVMKEFQKQINLSKVKANPYRAVLA